MTSASAKRPSPNMKTATRPSRFSNLTMANGGRDDKSPQPISSSFASPWQTPGAAGIWNSAGSSLNPIGSAFNPIKRDPTTSRGPDEHFPNGPTGSSALASTSEADWPTRSSAPWNAPDHPQTRPTSGNTSPNRARDAGSSSLNDIANSPAYLASRGPANYTGLPKASGALDSGSTFKYGSGFNEVQDEKDGSAPFGARVNSRFDADPAMRGYNRADKRPQDGFLNVVGGPSRDNSLPPSRHSEAEQHQTGYVDGMNGFSPFGSNTPNSGLAQRSSLPNHSASFASQVNSRAFAVNNQVPDEDLNAKFARSVTIQDPLEGASSSIPSFPNGTAAGFQFNPGSQPWNGETKPYANGYNPETYVDQISGPYIPMKLGSGDRGSPSGSQYRSTVSPKAFTSTPPSGVDAWSRPSSRDLRMAQDLERNRPGQPPFLPQQPAAFYPQPFYANYPPPYPSHLYDPFASAGHPGFRQPLALTQYLPVPPYLAGAAGVPLRAAKDQDHSKGIRSVVLEEFRASGKTNKKFELKDIYNHVVEFSGDQHGSRFIQAKLEGANSDEKDQVFREIEPNAVQLMKDVFGNYVIQKFFEHGNQVQKKILAGVMKNKMVDLSCQMYSCRVVQKAMEHVLVEQQAELVKELEPEVIRIIKDQNGNHVIQKVIEVVPGRYTRFIMDALRGSIREMASHSYGCRVIQRLMEHGSEEDKAAIMSEIHVCSTMLVIDQYGNYVTQHVLQHGKPEDRHRMIEIVVPQLLQLSKHKFASNVVEKCIEYGSDEDRQLILNKIYEKGQDGNSALQLMIKDQYGNYVIQKCLNSLQGAERVKFVDELRPIVVSLKKASTGRQTAALEKLLQACDDEQSKASETVMPAGPGLQIDAQSASQTPALTMEPNTPQSSNPPSTHNSTVGEGVSDTSKTQINGVGSEAPSVQVSDT